MDTDQLKEYIKVGLQAVNELRWPKQLPAPLPAITARPHAMIPSTDLDQECALTDTVPASKLPAVVVTGVDGEPLANTPVQFESESRSGTIQNPHGLWGSMARVATDKTGAATLPGWRPIEGMNRVIASAGRGIIHPDQDPRAITFSLKMNKSSRPPKQPHPKQKRVRQVLSADRGGSRDVSTTHSDSGERSA